MGLFSPTRRVSQPGLELGSQVFWRGFRCEVTAIDRERGLVWYTNGKYRLTTKLADLERHEGLGIWAVRGCEGPLPKIVRGEIVDPPERHCAVCGDVTHRRGGRCSSCIINGREAQGEVSG